ncbi:MAG: isopentenyl phosphate kinase [Chloroflexota bacterium]
MIFLKLGGSLITDKSRPETARLDVLNRLAAEIASALQDRPDLRLLIGHGSGSFGHSVAARFGTHRGAASAEEWRGFAEVWAVAGRLNRMVVDALRRAGLPVVGFPPSASTVCEGGAIVEMAHEPVARALRAGLVAVVGGDVAVDRLWGATIVSTERVFLALAHHLRPNRVLLAGLEPGVFADHPANTKRMDVFTEQDLHRVSLGGSGATDVTGGMADKVHQALELARSLPGLEVRIFSGEQPGLVGEVLRGATPGTLVRPA